VIRVIVASATLFGVGLTPAAHAGEGVGQAQAVVVRPLSLVKTEDLRFGSILAGASAGSVTISQTSGARSSAGGAIPIAADPFGPAQFTAAGVLNVLAIISVDSSTTISRIGGGATMNVSDLAANQSGLTVFPANGILPINVGGRLSVSANQMAGDYAGTFTLTVIYL
jgi:hypothetical protein